MLTLDGRPTRDDRNTVDARAQHLASTELRAVEVRENGRVVFRAHPLAAQLAQTRRPELHPDRCGDCPCRYMNTPTTHTL